MAEGSHSKAGKEQIEDLLKRLNLHEQEEGSFVWEEEVAEPPPAAKWLAIARVHTTRGFSPSALYADMRSAWNPAKAVVWRNIDDNLFTVQFGCLADWNKAMNLGPWLFRYQGVIDLLSFFLFFCGFLLLVAICVPFELLFELMYRYRSFGFILVLEPGRASLFI